MVRRPSCGLRNSHMMIWNLILYFLHDQVRVIICGSGLFDCVHCTWEVSPALLISSVLVANRSPDGDFEQDFILRSLNRWRLVARQVRQVKVLRMALINPLPDVRHHAFTHSPIHKQTHAETHTRAYKHTHNRQELTETMRLMLNLPSMQTCHKRSVWGFTVAQGAVIIHEDSAVCAFSMSGFTRKWNKQSHMLIAGLSR